MAQFDISKINESLRGTKFISDSVSYSMIKLDKSLYSPVVEYFSQLSDETYKEMIFDKDELSVILTEESIKASPFASQIKDTLGPLACITCDVSEGIGTVTGYLLAVTSVLSPNNISVYVQGAFTTDHIFVDFDQKDEAITLLNELKETDFKL